MYQHSKYREEKKIQPAFSESKITMELIESGVVLWQTQWKKWFLEILQYIHGINRKVHIRLKSTLTERI